MDCAQFLLTMKRSDQSAIYVAVYNPEEDADNALAGRKKYINAMVEMVNEVIYVERDMGFAHLNETFLKRWKHTDKLKGKAKILLALVNRPPRP